ncbi:hypothetical protein [Hathewaya limosa]|uniref:Uncharacterized protein n=1 Tax=Hathewaya limosa TaxID=1536 RepID=A0ABU0JRV5_HATLI|nr:hypothetical protein [Hathewaya limosa]MDQ0479155.1 hypothetical protein [Hathewaya limosa]
MNTEKLKIRISEEAYEKILSLLKDNLEYTHLRLKKGHCCRNKVELLLDIKKDTDLEDKIDDLQIIYSEDLLKVIKEVTIVYRNNSFLIKTIMTNNSFCGKKCSSNCKSNCKSSINQ